MSPKEQKLTEDTISLLKSLLKDPDKLNPKFRKQIEEELLELYKSLRPDKLKKLKKIAEGE